MSLVSDVQKALAGIASTLPDAVRLLEHGAEAGNVIKSSSVEMSGEGVTASGAVEKFRVIAKASDFPTLAADALVTFAEEPHVVTSLRTDPLGASLTIGLSEPLSRCAASVSGARGSRHINLPSGLLAVNNGLATDYADGFAPVEVYSWTLCISVDDWLETEAPQIGDVIRFEKNGDQVVKVARCTRRDGFYILNARSR